MKHCKTLLVSIIKEIAEWIMMNKEAIPGTRPWKVHGSSQKIKWEQTADALVIGKPQGGTNKFASVFKIMTKG